MQIYTVRPGDDLQQIAALYNVAIMSIIEANGLQNQNSLIVGQALVIPTADPEVPKPAINVNGYIYFLGEEAVPIVREVGRHLTYLCPFAYIIQSDGSLQNIDDAPAIEAAYEERVIPMMCIVNFTSGVQGENRAHEVLNNPSAVNALISNVLDIMREKGYWGLNVDFEYVLPEDRQAYNQFLQTAVDRLHPEGFFVSSALAPKTSPEQKGLLYEAHDYPVHGRILDFVVLMTYEWGYRLAAPQPISPLNKIREVLDYAVTEIPPNKIFFGFQIYARDWKIPHVQGQAAETFSAQEALRRAERFGAEIQYDTIAESPFFRYTDEQGGMHEVWFEDARSAQAKFDTVKEYGLGGISYWVLGYPFPENWTLLEGNFTIHKGVF